ncbi:ATPase [Candidatus Neomarinimicrobiota bacterium]
MVDLSNSDPRLQQLTSLISDMGQCIVACSGGLDSLLLATVAHRTLGSDCLIVHAVSPAVPVTDTQRVRDVGAAEGWTIQTIEAGEFTDEQYLSNPVNRCYFCKSHLYAALLPLAQALKAGNADYAAILSGANTDDLGEYRPGLDAAREQGIRHPYVESNLSKDDVRELATILELPFANLPASPCLSSRIYTGTRVTPERLAAIQFAEGWVKETTGLAVVRARLQADQMLLELNADDRKLLTATIVDNLRQAVQHRYQFIAAVQLDPEPYRPGRAFRTGELH